MPAKIDLLGKRFGRLEVISESPSVNGRARWICKCSCGTQRPFASSSLLSGTKSCGCIRIEWCKVGQITHGHTIGHRPSRILVIWRHMMSRCFNPSSPDWKNYGGRGITVCTRWMVFNNFLLDMGEGKIGWTLERLNNDGNYCPDNCCWAKKHVQSRNTRRNRNFTFFGQSKCMADWCSHFGLSLQTVSSRLNRSKWTPQRAFGIAQ